MFNFYIKRFQSLTSISLYPFIYLSKVSLLIFLPYQLHRSSVITTGNIQYSCLSLIVIHNCWVLFCEKSSDFPVFLPTLSSQPPPHRLHFCKPSQKSDSFNVPSGCTHTTLFCHIGPKSDNPCQNHGSISDSLPSPTSQKQLYPENGQVNFVTSTWKWPGPL